jgi:hypothetical protein
MKTPFAVGLRARPAGSATAKGLRRLPQPAPRRGRHVLTRRMALHADAARHDFAKSKASADGVGLSLVQRV